MKTASCVNIKQAILYLLLKNLFFLCLNKQVYKNEPRPHDITLIKCKNVYPFQII